jgi:AcrR family transcriptional regulator
VHRHFPAKEALYLAVATGMLEQLVAEAEVLAATGDPAALFTLLSRMMATGAENVTVKSALAAAEFDLRTAARTSRRTSRAMSRTCWIARTQPALRAAMPLSMR